MRDFTVASGAFSGSGVASTPGVGEGCSADCALSPVFTTLSGFTVSTVVSGLGAESRSSATPSPMPISAVRIPMLHRANTIPRTRPAAVTGDRSP